MKKLIFLLVCMPAMASGPKYNFEDPHLNDEMVNIYKDIGKGTGPNAAEDVLTKAQIISLTPRRAGKIYFCTDCTNDAGCISTGTARGALGRLTARTSQCS